MHDSVVAFLRHIVDYAGLFPPARLSLEEAATQYGRDRGEPHEWMLGRFICPAARLGELEALQELLFAACDKPVRLSVLGSGGETAEQFGENLKADVRAMTALCDRQSGRIGCGAFEVRLPPASAYANDSGRLHELIGGVGVAFGEAAFEAVPRYFEIPPQKRWGDALPVAVSVLADLQARSTNAASADGHDGNLTAGLKLRCGGAVAESFPSVERLAEVIIACRDARLPLKFTAGLHHPFRHYDAALDSDVHGFINVFSAAVLADALTLDAADIAAILGTQDANSFSFSAQSLRWQEFEVTTSQIEFVRARRALSFGSCSFDEPVADLIALGLL